MMDGFSDSYLTKGEFKTVLPTYINFVLSFHISCRDWANTSCGDILLPLHRIYLLPFNGSTMCNG